MLEYYNAVKSPLRKAQTHYKIVPKIVPAGKCVLFRITPLYEKLRFNGDYTITLYPVMQNGQKKEISLNIVPESDGSLKFSAEIGDEQEYNVFLRKHIDDKYEDVETFNIYVFTNGCEVTLSMKETLTFFLFFFLMTFP